MPRFGKLSRERLDTCHTDLQRLFEEVIKHYDCSVLCGHRGASEQNLAYEQGKSKLRFPKSKHNLYPSIAVDVVPYFMKSPHIRWSDIEKFREFVGFVFGIAVSLGIDLRNGGNWDMDDELHDSSFIDLPHFELVV